MESSSNFQLQVTQPLPFAAGETSAASAVDEAYINGVYAGLSFRSLLTYSAPPPMTYSNSNPLKTPKSEPFYAVSDDTPPYNFFSDATPSSFNQQYTLEDIVPYNFFSEATKTSSFVNQQLPDLISLEAPPLNANRFVTPSYMRRKQRQQQKLSDKTRCLQKLLPVEKKMDMATVLEEAYKYIKFLQAQVSVLQTMPIICDQSSSSSNSRVSENGGGDLGRLNRQEVLQVVVNSPVVQTQLYSKGCCVYSIEQLFLLKNKINGERMFAFHPYGV